MDIDDLLKMTDPEMTGLCLRGGRVGYRQGSLRIA
jgi:hypothetical protein